MNCRAKDKKWPRADNFRQHLKRIHQIQPGDDDLEKYVYRPQVSPGPDLAGLGTSVGDGLISLNIDHDELGSSPWTVSMQSVQEQISRDPCELDDYMGQQMDFQEDTVISQQHLAMTSRSGKHIPNNLIQMSPLDLQSDSSLSDLEQSHSQSQGLQDLCASSIGDQESSFEEPSFFNEASISDDGSEEDEQPVIHHVSGSDLTSAEDLCREPSTLTRQSSRLTAEASTDSTYHNSQDSKTAVDDDNGDGDDDDDTASKTPALDSSVGDECTQASPDAIPSSESQPANAQLDVSDVLKDQDKVYDIFKALKEQGLLAGLLEKVDYQTPKDTETPPKADPLTQRNSNKHTHVCPESGCEKSFLRQCELRSARIDL